MTSPGAGDPRDARAQPAPGPSPTAGSAGTRFGEHGPLGATANWPVQATDAVVSAVDTVRDKATGPLQTLARGLVYGVLAVVLGTMVAILLIISLIRGVDSLVSLFVDPPNIWITYLIVGVIFLVGGWFVFRRRRLAEL
ncbi:MAG TPA: hypothetical protein VIJ47_03635 [Acidimicrobiales bacterium]